MTDPLPDKAMFKRKSLEEQIADNLRMAIQDGTLAGHLPPERTLCQSLKASRPIIRRAIHHLQGEGLLKLTQGHPAEIIERVAAAPKIAGEKRVVLLFEKALTSISHWPLMVIDEIRKELYDQEFHFELIGEILAGRKHPGPFLRKLVERCRADHWILAGVPVAVQKWFQEQPLNVVMMGNTFPQIQFPFVNDDLRGVTRHAGGVFLGLGHRNIVFMMRDKGAAGETEEEAGFVEAFRKAKDASYLVVKHSGQVEQIHARLQWIFSQQPHATALLVSHAMDTLAVITWFLEKGIRIPQDVSLISFQWESFLERVRPLPAWYYTDPKAHARKLCRLVMQPSRRKRYPNLIIPTFVRNGAVKAV